MKPALVLAAGLLCDATIWRPVAELLADAADVTIVDFLGCATMGAMADRLLGAAPPRFALAGHSMGGRVALEAIARAPERVERLALLNTGVHAITPGEPASRRALVALAKAEGMRAVADAWLPPMMGASGRGDAHLMRALIAMIERATPEQFSGQQEALLDRPDAEAALARVSVPTLLLSATEDGWSPPAQHEAMLALAPQARLVIVQNAGHMVPVEQPGAIADALTAWLAQP